MIKKLVYLVLALMFTLPLKSQYADEFDKETFYAQPIKKRLVFGGDLSLSFGTVTYVQVAPLLGYRVTPRLTSGVSAKYVYYKFGEETHIYGGNIFSVFKGIADLHNVIPLGIHTSLVFYSEFEMLNVEEEFINSFAFDDVSGRQWTEYFWLGAGFGSPGFGKSGFYVLFVYDLLENYSFLYPNPNLKILLLF